MNAVGHPVVEVVVAAVVAVDHVVFPGANIEKIDGIIDRRRNMKTNILVAHQNDSEIIAAMITQENVM